MKALTDPRLMYLKAVLLLGAGLMAAALLVAESPTLRTVALLLVVIWSFSRVYYFCFYVMERYVDPAFRFSGVGAVVVYLLRRKRTARPQAG